MTAYGISPAFPKPLPVPAQALLHCALSMLDFQFYTTRRQGEFGDGAVGSYAWPLSTENGSWINVLIA